MNTEFYNTIAEQGETLIASEKKAKFQGEQILRYFKSLPEEEFTPCEVHENLHLRGPLTSTRRAISNLTKEGLLIKTANKNMGLYGKMNYTWKYSASNGQIKML